MPGVEFLGLLHRTHVTDVAAAKGIAGAEACKRFGVEHLRVLPEDGRGVRRHGAIDKRRDRWNLSPVLEAVQRIRNILRATDGKRRNKNGAAAPHGAAYDVGQFPPAAFQWLVPAITLGGFHDEQVGGGRKFGVPYDRRSGPPKIS